MMKQIAFVTMGLLALAACGGEPPAKNPNDNLDAPPTVDQGGRNGGPQVGQELGSIDQRAVENMVNRLLNGKLESACHKQGLGRIDTLAGDAKMFFRVDANGKVRYSYFEDSTLGDRETEKCILDTFATADWPKPVGGEAEVRNGFSWEAGDARPPATWPSDKVTNAFVNPANKATKESIDKCTAGTSGFKVTGYVEEADLDVPVDDAKTSAKGGGAPKKKPAGKPNNVVEPTKGGKFKTLGVSVSSKEAADKIDCLVDALKQLRMPTPGSYMAKVTFTM